jgi:hypothetical protein
MCGCPVSVSVDDELRRRGTTTEEAVVEGALDVVEGALHNTKMRLTGVVHVKAHLLDHVGNVKSGEGEVLESPDQVAVSSRVTDRGAHVRGDLGLSVEQRGAGLAVTHANTLKDISSVLAFVQEEVVVLLLHCDIEEVVQGSEVLHDKLSLEGRSGTLEKLRVRGGEDDVVNVEHQVSSVGAAAVDEQRGVRLGLHKAQQDQVGGEAVVPSMRCLLYSVEGPVELTHQLRVSGIYEADVLGAVDRLGESVVEETSCWCTSQPLETARVSTVRTVVDCTMGLKVSL